MRLRLALGCGIVGAALVRAQNTPVGLSLLVENGSMKPLTLYGNPPRYINEIDLVFTAPVQPADDGIAPLIKLAQVAKLDWSGVKMVDEDWRATGDTFRRQRFYRNANWMNSASQISLYPTDAGGRRVGAALTMAAGRDDKAGDGDAFVRRFVARQIANGCKSREDCKGATFASQALIQLRINKRAGSNVAVFPPETAGLELEWTQNPGAVYRAAVKHAAENSLPYGYGFQVALELPQPPNGRYFMPGEALSIRAVFRDGNRRDLFEKGKLSTYGQFVRDEVPAGLGYYSNRIDSTVYYALKHREANILVALSGPTDRLRVAKSVLDGNQLFEREAVVAKAVPDGYSGVFTGLPSFAISLGPPARLEDPVSDIVPLTIPKDAQPGTYIAAIKARRMFGGEALNRAATVALQVGTSMPTAFTPATGKCETCHQGSTSFANVLHGVTDRRACFACHIGLSFEPDNALDIRVHSIHSRSRRFGPDARNCTVCHLTVPKGPARGMLAQ